MRRRRRPGRGRPEEARAARMRRDLFRVSRLGRRLCARY